MPPFMGILPALLGYMELDPEKIRFMQWCLAESKRELNRASFKSARSISISCDKRRTRFLLRFRCVCKDLRLRTGVVHISQCLSGTAADHKTAILRGLESAMTPGKPPRTIISYGGDAVDTHPCQAQRDMVKSLCSKVEHFAADGASDVQLAGRELATSLALTGPTAEQLQGVILQDLPNIKAVSRDRSHACQRISLTIGTPNRLSQHVGANESQT